MMESSPDATAKPVGGKHVDGAASPRQLRPDEQERTAYYLSKLRDGLDSLDTAEVTTALRRLKELGRRGGTGYVLGNGGSASTAAHFVNDITRVAMLTGRVGLRLHCLSDNIPTITAIANDHGYREVFVRQLRNLLTSADLVIGISTRGNSPNVVDAIRYARSRGVETLALVGYDGGLLRRLADHVIHAPVHDLRRVEDLHHAVCHMLSALLMEA